MNDKVILITGVAGFIGAHLAIKLLKDPFFHGKIIGIDNLNDYYDVQLKEERLELINKLAINRPNIVYEFIKGDISNKSCINTIFSQYKPQIVVNLAAQAGVRYSITNPDVYMESNVMGFYNIVEACRNSYHENYGGVEHLVYASSSSVYGLNKKIPYSTEDKVDKPVSLYAATKKSNELLAYSYSKLYHIPTTGLRFFTVYGPMGRPDMAYFKFANLMVQKKKIQLYNYGDMKRDFTYIDDIVEGVYKVLEMDPSEDEDGVKYKIYNIGNNKPETLNEFVNLLEEALVKEGIVKTTVEREYLPMQPGDVYQTYACIDQLKHDLKFSPTTSLEYGLSQFAKWYVSYYDKNLLNLVKEEN